MLGHGTLDLGHFLELLAWPHNIPKNNVFLRRDKILTFLCLSGLPFEESFYQSDKKILDCEINCLLKQSIKPRANKKKKKATEKEVTEDCKPVVSVQNPPKVIDGCC